MGLDAETLTMILDAIRGFVAGRLPDERLLELDAHDEFPADVVRGMCGEELGIQLLFIPEVHGGMGGDAVDVYRVCEQMAAIDLGVATGVLATFLGSEPILVGGTPTSGCGRGASGPPRIDGTAVLPGVMGIEGFAELAGLVLPGWRVAADCELGSVRQLAGRPEPQVTTHFTGRMRLSRAAPAEPPGDAPPGPAGTAVERDDVYRVYIHGPAFQVLERAWRDGDRTVGLLRADLPAGCVPADAPLLMAPRLIELAFQTAGIRELGSSGRMGLPDRARRVAVLHPAEGASGRLYAIVGAPGAGGTVDADVVDETGRMLVRLEGYSTVELPAGPEPELLASLRAAMA